MRARRLVVALALLAIFPAAGRAAATACDVRLNVTDQDPAGLNVRASPAGAVVGALKAKGRWVQVHVTAQDGAWAKIDGAMLYTEDDAAGSSLWKGQGWVAFSKLGFEELDTQSLILAAPDDGARTLLRISEGDEARVPRAEVLGCSGGFVQVRVKGIVGWTRTFCANQFTTCV
ncbi:MAG TPA: hypothetical protein VMT68_01015 [Caulobacteraceae bacterium]|nr:hypothetical protein [Caulobacteraceae bacterium]